MAQKIIIIGGPTAVGKSDAAIELAQKIDGEIISADSVQVYKGMDIGSAKVSSEDRKKIPHHLIDILEPNEDFGVDIFCRLASMAINEISERNKIPIIVGGTSFYIQALLKGVDFSQEEEHDKSYRNELLLQATDDDGKKRLHAMLYEKDPQYAAKTPYQNVKRVVRALEYIHYTGMLFSEYNSIQSQKEAIYDYNFFALTDNREAIYERINARVDVMLRNGLIDEVQKLRAAGYSKDLKSMQSIGYKEINEYIDGTISYDEASYLIKLNTRHFAKRQLTWLRREENVTWIDISKGQKIVF